MLKPWHLTRFTLAAPQTPTHKRVATLAVSGPMLAYPTFHKVLDSAAIAIARATVGPQHVSGPPAPLTAMFQDLRAV